MAYKRDRAPYGYFLNVIGSLPVEEQQEYWRVHDRKFRSRQAQARLAELHNKAHRLWEEKRAEPRTPENDLSLYAQQVRDQMLARRASDSSSEQPTDT